MIIQGSNIKARWYLHRVTVNFIDKDGIMMTTRTPLAREGTSGTQIHNIQEHYIVNFIHLYTNKI